MRMSVVCLLALLLPAAAGAQRLFVGLEDASLVTKSTNLSGFPIVQYTSHFPFEVNGATATPEGLLYLCNGPFTTRLYRSTLAGPPAFVIVTGVDLHGLGYGRGRLYGFSNFSSPMGIYEINTTNGAATLVINTSGPGYRFFGLDFNTVDGLLYGYTEYGVSGLYSIDTDTGIMTKIVSPPPGVNGQGRALAVGNNTVYLMATRGDEGEPCFAYDLSQGQNGQWVPFTNPYPAYHSTGGAAWIPPDPGGVDPGPVGTMSSTGLSLSTAGPNPFRFGTELAITLPHTGPVCLEIFSPRGHRAMLLAEGSWEAGRHTFTCGLRDDGRTLPAGVYLARLQAGGEVRSLKLVLAP